MNTIPRTTMQSSETHQRWQEPQEKSRVERRFKVEDSKRVLKQAIFAHGGEKLRADLRLAERQQLQRELEAEERAFSEMLESNSEDEDLEARGG